MVMDDEHRELLAGFLVESRELLDEVEPELIRLEQDARTGSVQGDTLDKVFRLFHSLKGGAGMLNLAVIQQVTHKAESVLSLYRKGLAHPNAGHIDLLNKALDFVRHLLDKVEEQGNDQGQEEEAPDPSPIDVADGSLARENGVRQTIGNRTDRNFGSIIEAAV